MNFFFSFCRLQQTGIKHLVGKLPYLLCQSFHLQFSDYLPLVLQQSFFQRLVDNKDPEVVDRLSTNV